MSEPPTRDPVLQAAADAHRGTLMERLGLEWMELTPDRVVARLPVDGNRQPYGLLHGGATAALIETIGSFGATLGASADRQILGVQLSVNHLRPVRDGWITGTGTPVHSGRTTAVWDVRVEDDGGRLV
ncbi:MAG TPA: PaaI family thioesterase, partial [Actinomycetota bacterium]|nr:PaaI family thioesterase [Actinomycetota bacterium]